MSFTRSQILVELPHHGQVSWAEINTGVVPVSYAARITGAGIVVPIERYAQSLTAQGASSVISPASTIQAGTTAIMCVTSSVDGKVVSSVTDNAGGNTWTVDTTYNAAASNYNISFISCSVATAILTSNTITINYAVATSNQMHIWIEEVGGLSVSPFDKNATGTGTSTSIATSSTGALSQPVEIVFVGTRLDDITGWAHGSGYSNVTTPTLSTFSSLEYKIVTDGSAQTGSGTVTNSSNYAMQTATYRAAMHADNVAYDARITGVVGANNYTDADTAIGVAVPSAAELANYVDAGTAIGVAVPSAADTGQRVDAGTVTGVAVPSATELANYVDAATAIGIAVPSSTDVAAYVDAATAIGIAVPSAIDTGQRVDAGIVTGVAVPSSVELANYVDAGTVTGVAVPSMVEVTPPDAGTAIGVAVPSGTDVAAYIDAATVTGVAVPSVADTGQRVDAGTVSGVAVPSAVELANYVDSGTIIGVAVPSGVDTGQRVDAATVVGVAVPSSSDVAAYVDAGTVTGVAVPSAVEIYGKETSQAWDARITAPAFSTTTQDARATGQDTSSQAWAARITGDIKQGQVSWGEINSGVQLVAYDARVFGAIATNVAYDARLTGFAFDFVTYDARITGSLSNSVAYDARTGGAAMTNRSNDARVIGATLDSVAFDVRLHPAELQDSDSWDVRIGGYTLQHGRPVSDNFSLHGFGGPGPLGVGSWTSVPGGTLASTLDETVPDDTDYIISPAGSTSPDDCEVQIGSLNDPFTKDNHRVNYRFTVADFTAMPISLTVRLMQGTTEIAHWTHPALQDVYGSGTYGDGDFSGGYWQFSQLLTNAQAALITDYTDLRLQFISVEG